jgi:hypothetical protein
LAEFAAQIAAGYENRSRPAGAGKGRLFSPVYCGRRKSQAAGFSAIAFFTSGSVDSASSRTEQTGLIGGFIDF